MVLFVPSVRGHAPDCPLRSVETNRRLTVAKLAASCCHTTTVVCIAISLSNRHQTLHQCADFSMGRWPVGTFPVTSKASRREGSHRLRSDCPSCSHFRSATFASTFSAALGTWTQRDRNISRYDSVSTYCVERWLGRRQGHTSLCAGKEKFCHPARPLATRI
jgi:hypothetical protein